MKNNLYSMKDTKMGKFAMPFVAPNDEIAKRTLASTIKQGGSTISEFPEDFQLFRLGNYDEDTGDLTTDNEFIANATEFAIKTKSKDKKIEEE